MADRSDLVGFRLWNKAIRDRVVSRFPEGVGAITRPPADDEEWQHYLRRKLDEEVRELRVALASGERANGLDELADVHEVLVALAKAHGFAAHEIVFAKARKRRTHGGFATKTILVSTDDRSETTAEVEQSIREERVARASAL